jgi:uncharacterized OB-fold protein
VLKYITHLIRTFQESWRLVLALRPCKECGKQISTDAKTCPHCGKKVDTSFAAGCLTVIIALLVLAILRSAFDHPNNNGVSNPTVTEDPQEIALSQIKLVYAWRKEGFGNIMHADFTIKNESNYNIKDFEITCRHFSRSGTQIDSNTRTIYDIVKAHSQKQFNDFDMGFIHSQVNTSTCTITDLKIAP